LARSLPSPLPGLGHPVTIAGVIADAASMRGGVVWFAYPVAAGAGGAPS